MVGRLRGWACSMMSPCAGPRWPPYPQTPPMERDKSFREDADGNAPTCCGVSGWRGSGHPPFRKGAVGDENGRRGDGKGNEGEGMSGVSPGGLGAVLTADSGGKASGD